MASRTALPALLVSDLAGTAMREEGGVLTAYRTALSEHDIPFTDADLHARRGANKRTVFQELAARRYGAADVPDVAARALERFERALRQEYETGTVEEISGANGAFQRLKEAGVKLALTSGFERTVVDLLVRRLGWSTLFDLVVAGTDVPMGRPAPFLIYHAMMQLGVHDVSRVAVVGDTALDLQAGSNARTGWVIGVLSGAHGLADLGAARHTHLLESVAALPGLFGLDGSS